MSASPWLYYATASAVTFAVVMFVILIYRSAVGEEGEERTYECTSAQGVAAGCGRGAR